MLKRLARTCYRRRWRVLAVWVVFLVAVSVFSSAAGGVFRNEFSLSGSESEQAQELLKERGFGDRAGFSGQIVFATDRSVDDPNVRQAMEQLFARVERTVPRTQVVSPYATEGARQVSENRRIAYGEVNFADRSDKAFQDAADEVKAEAEAVKVPGVRIELGGKLFSDQELPASEAIGVFAAIIVLLIAFGSVLAAGLPILTALFGVGTGIALVQLTANGLTMPEFTTQAVAMIGIGVGIDYALLIITRYRQAVRDGHNPESAVALAADTAGRSVVFAGTTVVIAVLGMLLINVPAIRGLAVGIALGVLMTMLAASTLLPAVLGFVGRNIDKLGLPHKKRAEGEARESFWYRWSRVLQRRPWPPAITGLVVLLVLAAPVLSMRLAFADAGNKPTSDTTRRAYDLLVDGFGPGFNGPMILAADMQGGQRDLQTLDRLSGELNSTPGVAFATQPRPNQAGNAAILQVFPKTSPQSEETANLVDRLRNHVIPAATRGTDVDVKVGGITAGATDYSNYTAERLPVFIGLVLILSFLLLMVVFRSVLVPLKAVIMNLLSIGAAYGVIVAVFQWGWLKDLIGVANAGPVEAWAPMMLFAIVFGLSMDYEVFLLSRMREEYDRTGNNATAVADGLAATARVITAAAAIMIFVFSAFVLGDDRAIKLFGFGLAAAVFLDATIVRLILVPATMELLGDWNWWIPKWLDRILPRVKVDVVEDELDRELHKLEEAESTEPVGTAR
jgi:putative drug exporter of the RND superfamily